MKRCGCDTARARCGKRRTLPAVPRRRLVSRWVHRPAGIRLSRGDQGDGVAHSGCRRPRSDAARNRRVRRLRARISRRRWSHPGRRRNWVDPRCRRDQGGVRAQKTRVAGLGCSRGREVPEFRRRLISSGDSRSQRASTGGPGDQEVKSVFFERKSHAGAAHTALSARHLRGDAFTCHPAKSLTDAHAGVPSRPAPGTDASRTAPLAARRIMSAVMPASGTFSRRLQGVPV